MPANLSISDQTTGEFESTISCDPRYGADLRFLGVVRYLEDGREIDGIEYSSYPEMARSKLAAVCQDIASRHPDHAVWIHHRIGFVPAGEASIVIRVQTSHSAEGFTLCQEYLRRIKTTVPIWKHPVFAT